MRFIWRGTYNSRGSEHGLTEHSDTSPQGHGFDVRYSPFLFQHTCYTLKLPSSFLHHQPCSHTLSTLSAYPYNIPLSGNV